MPSGLAALDSLGLLPLASCVRHRPLRGWQFWLERQPLFSCREPIGSGEACLLLDPSTLLEALATELRACPGAELHLGQRVVDVSIADPQGARAAAGEGRINGVRLSDGSSLNGELVIACDGRGSRLRRAAGLALASASEPMLVLWFQLPSPHSRALEQVLDGGFHTVLCGGEALALYPSACGGVQLGWPLPSGDRSDLSSAQWRQRWLQLCPPPLAEALAQVPPEAIAAPLRLPVQVGLAERWWRPGLLLLGDAAHPMSPVRAQGTAMGLRDAAVAVDALAPLFKAALPATPPQEALDAALATIERRRRPEIARIQQLQEQEWQRGERLHHSPALRGILAAAAPILGPLLAAVWQRSQAELRQGMPGGLAIAGGSGRP